MFSDLGGSIVMTLLSHLKAHPNRIGITIGLILLAIIVVYIVLYQRHRLQRLRRSRNPASLNRRVNRFER